MVSVSSPAKSLSDNVIPASFSPARTASASMTPSAALARSSAGRYAGMLRLTMTLPIGRPNSLSSSMASSVSWIGSASSRVTRWMAVRSECSTLTTLSACECTGPPLARSRHRLGDVEEAGDAAGRRRVDDDGVVNGLLALLGAGDDLPDLAGEQHVAQARRDRRRELDGPDPAHGAAGEAEVVEHVEVLEERGLGVDRQRVDGAATVGGGDLDLLVGQRWHVEQLRDALPPFDFHQQHLAAACGERQRQRGGDGRLTGAAFAGDEVQPRLGQAGRPTDRAAVAQRWCPPVHANQVHVRCPISSAT